jgi:hypothetical protein
LKLILRGGLGMCGGLALILALGFLVQPEVSADRLGLTASGPLGLSSLRGDMTGLFALIGSASLIAAVRGRAGYLAAPAAMVGVILFGRCVSAVLDGSGSAALPLIGVEILMLAVMVGGVKVLGNVSEAARQP